MSKNRGRNGNGFAKSLMRKGLAFAVLILLFVAAIASGGVVAVAGTDEGKIAFVSAGNIHIINPDGTNEVRLTEGTSPVWSPDGKKIAYIGSIGRYTFESELYVINVDGTGKIKLAEGESFSWSPDGRKILFIEGKVRKDLWEKWYTYPIELSVCIVNVDGSNLVRLITDITIGGHFGYPTLSPDGKKIAYISDVYISYISGASNHNIYIMNPDGSDKTKLVEESPIECFRWSPDGKKLTYSTPEGLFIIDVDGTNKIKLAKGMHHVWSPDGKKIAYSDSSNLWVMNPDGTGKTMIVEGGLYRSIFSWSPDGKKIVYGKDEAIYIVNADGSGLTKLVYGSYPQWSPAPTPLLSPTPLATPTPTLEPTVTPTLAPTEDTFNYKGEYTFDLTKLREEEKRVLPYVMKYTKEYKVSPCLIMAVIRQESDFFDYSQDPDKDKTKFDIGYMQVSHIAAIDTYKEYTRDEYKGTEEEWQKDGLDPDINIKYGTRYLRIQHERIRDGHYKDVYNDILKSTLSAYNVGHPTKDNEKYVGEVIQGRELIDGQRRGYEFFLTIRVPVGGAPALEKGIPGFEAALAIAGLLAVAYFLRRRK